MTNEDLLLEQQRVEEQATGEGIHRFRERLQTAQKHEDGAQVGASRKLLTRGVEPVAVALQEMLEESVSKPGRKHGALRWVEMLGVDETAFLTMKVLLDQVHSLPSVRVVSSILAGRVLDELRFRRMREHQPRLFDYKMEHFNTGDYDFRKKSLDNTLSYLEEEGKLDLSDLVMSPSQRIQVGGKLIDVALQATGLFRVKVKQMKKISRGARPKTSLSLRLTEEAEQWLDKRNGVLELLTPVDLPMVVPPLPWSAGESGGYRFGLRARHALIRGFPTPHNRNTGMALMPRVYAALNVIQATPWRINPALLEALEAFRDTEIADLPGADRDLPAKPEDIATNEDAKRSWKTAARKVREDNILRRQRRLHMGRTLSVAKQYVPYGQIYFPHNLDFRGRVYPIASRLSPQGEDFQKALLEFAQGKALGEHGWRYLAVHGANLMGDLPDGRKVSTLTLEEREAWVVENLRQISDAGKDPSASRLWTGADKPWQFLAFCTEIYRLELHCQVGGKGDTFVSHLPVAMDGSCNGIQHFSALLRDPKGGAAVNLLPSAAPSDLYQLVSEDLLDLLTEDGSPMALLWLGSGLVNRKLCKRPVMTAPYGSRKFGFSLQIMGYLREHEDWKTIKLLFKDGEKDTFQTHCVFLAGLMWAALGRRAVAAMDCMDWMRAAGALATKAGRPIMWTVPGTEFPVLQEYYKAKVKRVELILAGKLRKPTVYETTRTPDGRKQLNSIAPNFIHSLDAACLMQAVIEAWGISNVTSFGMVHDSFATVAGDAHAFGYAIRKSFVDFYLTYDPLETLRESLQSLSPEPLPVVPAKGDLDVSVVLYSAYAFC